MDQTDIFDLFAETINLTQRLAGESDRQVCCRQVRQRLSEEEIRTACKVHQIKERGEKRILVLVDKVLNFDSTGNLLSQSSVITKF